MSSDPKRPYLGSESRALLETEDMKRQARRRAQLAAAQDTTAPAAPADAGPTAVTPQLLAEQEDYKAYDQPTWDWDTDAELATEVLAHAADHILGHGSYEDVKTFVDFYFAPLDTPEKRQAAADWSMSAQSYSDMPPGVGRYELVANMAPVSGTALAWRDVVKDVKSDEVSGWTAIDALSGLVEFVPFLAPMVGMLRKADDFKDILKVAKGRAKVTQWDRDMAARINANPDGGSVSLAGKEPDGKRQRFMVAPDKKTETTFEQITPDEVAEFREKWADELGDKDTFLGWWENTLDVSRGYRKLEDAQKVATHGQQQGIVDVAPKHWARPVPEGHVRVYRGVNPERLKIRGQEGGTIPGIAKGESEGGWFTTSYQEAVDYANWDYEGAGELRPDGAVLFIDLPTDDAVDAAHRGNRIRFDDNDFIGAIEDGEVAGDGYFELLIDDVSGARLQEGNPEIAIQDNPNATAGDFLPTAQAWDDLTDKERIALRRDVSGVDGKPLVPGLKAELEREMVDAFDPATKKWYDSTTQGARDRSLEAYIGAPPPEELATMLALGEQTRGWYRNAAESIHGTFGEDAGQFGAMLSALSPQVPVPDNLRMAVDLWDEWVRAGRTADPEGIEALFDMVFKGEGASGHQTHMAIKNAAMNNLVTVLTDPNPLRFNDPKLWSEGKVLSGTKVDPFWANVMGELGRVTSDTHVQRLTQMKKDALSLSRRAGQQAAWTRAGKYLEDQLDLPPGTIQTANAQEMGWEPARQLDLMRQSADFPNTNEEVLFGSVGGDLDLDRIDELRDAMHRAQDFSELMHERQNVEALARSGYTPAEVPRREGLPDPERAIQFVEDNPEDLRRAVRRMDDFNRGEYLWQVAPLAGGGLLLPRLRPEQERQGLLSTQ